MGIIIKSRQEIEIMREAGRIVARVLEVLKSQVKPGIKTRELKSIIIYPPKSDLFFAFGFLVGPHLAG